MTAGEVRSTTGGFRVSVPHLNELIEPDEFTRRHIGPSPADLAAMLRP